MSSIVWGIHPRWLQVYARLGTFLEVVREPRFGRTWAQSLSGMEWACHVGRHGSSFTRTATSENQNIGLAHLSAHSWAHFWAHTWLTLGSLLAYSWLNQQ